MSNQASSTVNCPCATRSNHREQFTHFESLVVKGKITVTEAARQMNIGITTYYRLRKAQKAQKSQGDRGDSERIL